jgi:hypothetical protein
MIEACTRAGLAEPEFTEVGLRFRVIIRTARSLHFGVNPTEMQTSTGNIITAMSCHGFQQTCRDGSRGPAYSHPA